MATAQRKKLVCEADSALIDGLQEIAERDEREVSEVLEDAIRSYLMLHRYEGVRPEVMAHFKASLNRNRRLYELLSD